MKTSNALMHKKLAHFHQSFKTYMHYHSIVTSNNKSNIFSWIWALPQGITAVSAHQNEDKGINGDKNGQPININTVN